MDVPLGNESLHQELLTQIGYRGERGLLRGAKTTATKTCLELGLLIGKMIGTGEVTQEWGMQAIMAIGMGNWGFFKQQPELDSEVLGKWTPHPRCVAFYRPTYLDQIKYQLAFNLKSGKKEPITQQELTSKLTLEGNRQLKHLERVLKQAVRNGVLRRFGKGGWSRSYSLVHPEQVSQILEEAAVDPQCSKCARRLKFH